jgi:hypothetical protein
MYYTYINVSVRPEINNTWKFGNSWNNAINNAIIFGQKSVDLFFNVIIFLPVILVLYFVIRKIKK